MDTTDTLNLMLDAVSVWAFEEVESKIEEHKRMIERLNSQKRMLKQIVGQYKAAQVKAAKRMKAWEKQSRQMMRRADKNNPPVIMGPATAVVARKVPA